MDGNQDFEEPPTKMRKCVTYEGTIQEMAYEVLVQILKNLPIRDRKNAKLVCQKWNEACRDTFILDSEKFFFNGLYSFSDAVTVLERCQNRFYNLEFRDTRLDTCFCEFLRDHGSRIRNLALTECMIKKKTLNEVITHCPNLSSFSWQHTRLRKYPPSLELIDGKKLIENDITRPKLRFLEFAVSDECLSMAFVADIFTIFPKLEKFVIYFPFLQYPPYFEGFVELIEPTACKSEFLDKVEFRFNSVWPLTLNSFEWFGSLPNGVKITQLPPIKTELSVDLLSSWVDEQSRFAKNLKSFGYFVCDYDAVSVSNFLGIATNVVNDCPNLRLLQLKWPIQEDNELSLKFLKKLSTTRLETLMIIGDTPSFELKIFSDLDIPPCPTLTSLLLFDYSASDEDEITALMRLFPNLQHVALSYIGGNILCELKRTLKSLFINLRDDFVSRWFLDETDRSSPVLLNRFTDLTCLKIRTSQSLPHGLIDLLVLPNVRYLEIKNRRRTIWSDLLLWAPNIEYLRLIGVKSSYGKLIAFLRRSHKLRFLQIDQRVFNLNKEHWKNCFVECPTLRYLLTWTKNDSKLYFYDVLKKKVGQKKSVTYQLTNEEFGPISKNWAAPYRLLTRSRLPSVY